MSRWEFVREFWGDVFSVGFTLVVCLTFVSIWFNDGATWVYEDNEWILVTEILACAVALPLSVERLLSDLNNYRERKLYVCSWEACGLNVDGLCSMSDAYDIRTCKDNLVEGWGREA